MRSIVTVVSILAGSGQVLQVHVSVPFVACLLDGKKYISPDDVPPPESLDLRRMRQEKAPRAPSLRVLVR